MGINVGIDLGTTFSAVAYIDPISRKAEIVKTSEGATVTPSVVAILENGEVIHGARAKDLREEGYVNTASFFKCSMGDPNYLLPLCGKNYSPTDLSALLLKGIVRDAEKVLGQKIDGAVITCPAYFCNREKVATLEAGKQAGINVLSLLPEPTAAAFAYGLNQKSGTQTVLIYDLGGGTFDVTVAKIDDDEITVLGSAGNHSLGGKNWDEAISRWIISNFEEEFSLDMTESDEQLSILTGISESAKKRLSTADSADITVYYKGKKGKYSLSLAEFNSITSYMLIETQDIINQLFSTIKVNNGTFSWNNITGVILVGGSTRMRMVSDYVFKMTGREPLHGINEDEAVALGAAIRANQSADGKRRFGLSGSVVGSKKITDVTAHALGMISVSEDGEKYVTDILIEKNEQIPCKTTLRRQLRVRRKQPNELEVYLLQGSDPFPLNCDITGKYTFSNIKYVEGGTALIDITYSYNSNGIIEVDARQVDNSHKLKTSYSTDLGNMDWVAGSPKDMVETIPVEGEIYLIADLSGSMYGALDTAKEAMIKFVEEADLDIFKIGVMGVADSLKLYLKPTHHKQAILSGINSMEIGDCGGCNAAHPFDRLLTAFSRDCDIKYAIVLADGIWEHQDFAVTAAKKCHKKGIEIIGLGFGSADKRFMQDISSQKDLAVITQLGSLTTSFSKIAQIIGSRGNSVTRR